ncbi:MAG: DUF2298 domain-containing protein [Flexilinea sp.]
MIIEILKWLFVLFGFGILGYSISFQFLRFLPDRGFGFSLPVGLIISGYFYWLLCCLGMIGNNSGGIFIALMITVIISALFWKKNFREMLAWLRMNWHHILEITGLFLIAFILILIFRLADPNIAGTEKPMEMTFINGILRSVSFPPHDSWLSGYAISYYYFGYILTALLIKISGVIATSGFNLMLASIYAMAASAAFELVNDLLELGRSGLPERIKSHFGAWCAPIFVLFAGNLEGFLEVLHAKGFFWNPDGTSAFWKWINLKELTEAPARLSSWDPTLRQGIWWWRASRVVSDTGLDGSSKEIIDEFPFFSFYLGDLHPHVLGIPFVILAAAVALNTFIQILRRKSNDPFWGDSLSGISSIREKGIVFRFLSSGDFWFSALCLGSLIFMNTWDFPFYFSLYIAAVFIAYFQKDGWRRKTNRVFLGTAVLSGSACVLLYGIFLLGLSSQAGGVIPSGVFTTRTIHLIVMFGLFLFPSLIWLITAAVKTGRKQIHKWIRLVGLIFLVLAILETLIFGILALFRNLGPSLQQSSNSILNSIGNAMMLTGSAYAGTQGFTNIASPVSQFLLRRTMTLPTMLILFGGITCILVILAGFMKTGDNYENSRDIQIPSVSSSGNPADIFVSLMLLIGFGLIIVPEFFYLRDFFGTRMNTIFKFYYQVWILMGLASAYLWNRLNQILEGKKTWLLNGSMMLITICALVYPIFGTISRIESFQQKAISAGGFQNLTLDGAEFLERNNPDDWAGIEWLQKAEVGVVAEKVGASYTSDNSVSTFSGLPAILGPTNHESQWRGGYAEIGSREDEVRQIYESRSWVTAKELIDRYAVRYIFIGSAERSAYELQEQKFQTNLALVFESGNCRIYQVY